MNKKGSIFRIRIISICSAGLKKVDIISQILLSISQMHRLPESAATGVLY